MFRNKIAQVGKIKKECDRHVKIFIIFFKHNLHKFYARDKKYLFYFNNFLKPFQRCKNFHLIK